ncbi:helix-turn-helix domain-containing protein [Vibrio sp.]|nr:helix-turn-helix domain-containing protein [Vibrio sp.]
MYSYILTVCLLLSSIFLSFSSSSTPIFYPLPYYQTGEDIVVDKIYQGIGQELWFLEHGNIPYLFSGEKLTPVQPLEVDSQYHILYAKDAFWFFKGNELNKQRPQRTSEVIHRFDNMIDVHNVGVNNDLIWSASTKRLHLYHVKDSVALSIPLDDIYQYSKTSQIEVNDVLALKDIWLLATNFGLFYSNSVGQIYPFPSTSNDYYTSLYFSKKHQQVVAGTLHSVQIFDLTGMDKPFTIQTFSQVLSIEEGSDNYWLGTESGLFLYSFQNQSHFKVTQQNKLNDFSLPNGKVLDLLNDGKGGMWIATSEGIRYTPMNTGWLRRESYPIGVNKDSVIGIQSIHDSSDYWVKAERALYRVSLFNHTQYELVYDRRVNEVAQIGNTWYLATELGIKCLDQVYKLVVCDEIPPLLDKYPTPFLAIDTSETLWGISLNNLWSYHPQSKHFRNYGSDWIYASNDNLTPTHIVHTMQLGTLIGTENGIVQVHEERIQVIDQSQTFGELYSVKEDDSGGVWVAAAYGLFYINSSGKVIKVSTPSAHAKANCIIPDGRITWVALSSGLLAFNQDREVIYQRTEPHGLINNEFYDGVCTGSKKYSSLLFGTKYGLTAIDTLQLKELKHHFQGQLVTKQILVDDQVLSIGNRQETIPFSNKQTVAIDFGVLPRSHLYHIEYQFNDQHWQTPSGYQLFLSNLSNSDITLKVRACDALSCGTPSIFILEYQPQNNHYLRFIYSVSGLFLLIGIVSYHRRVLKQRANDKQQMKALAASKKELFSLYTKEKKTRVEAEGQINVLPDNIEDIIIPIYNFVMEWEGKKMIQFSHFLNYILDCVGHHQIQVEGEKRFEAKTRQRSVYEDYAVDWSEKQAIDRGQALYHLLTRIIDKTTLIEVKTEYDQGSTLFSLYLHRSQLFITEDVYQQIEKSFPILSDIGLIFIQSQHQVRIQVCFTTTLITPAGLPTTPIQSEEHQQTTWLKKLNCIVEEKYSMANLSLSDVASQLFMSERSLQRRIKGETKMTFQEYLTTYRLEKASLYKGHNKKVQYIAYECGFSDPSYFTQRFKLHFGCTPSHYFKQNHD